jgi:hypothetical protein
MNKFTTYKSGEVIQTLSLDLVKEFIDSYWVDIMERLNEDQVVHIIFKVEYADNSFKSFSNMNAITNNHKCKQVIYDNIKFYILNNLSHYEQLQVKSILFSYIISDSNLNHESHSSLRTFINHNPIEIPDLEISESSKKEYDFLPKTMSLGLWSPNITFRNGHRIAYFISEGNIFNFTIYNNYYVCTIVHASNNSILLKFKDILGSSSLHLNKLIKNSESMALNSFTRIIYKKGADSLWNYEFIKYEYVDGILVRTEKRKIVKYLKLSKKFPRLTKAQESE